MNMNHGVGCQCARAPLAAQNWSRPMLRRFDVNPLKEGTGRRALGRLFAGKRVHCYTLEASFYASAGADGPVPFTQVLAALRCNMHGNLFSNARCLPPHCHRRATCSSATTSHARFLTTRNTGEFRGSSVDTLAEAAAP